MKTKDEIATLINFLSSKRSSDVTVINLKTNTVASGQPKPKPCWQPKTPPIKHSKKSDAALEKWKKIRAGELPKPNNPVTDERRAKLSAIHKGKVISDETKAKMSATKQATRAAKEAQITCPHCGFMGWNSPNKSFNKAHAYMTDHHFDHCLDRPK